VHTHTRRPTTLAELVRNPRMDQRTLPMKISVTDEHG